MTACHSHVILYHQSVSLFYIIYGDAWVARTIVLDVVSRHITSRKHIITHKSNSTWNRNGRERRTPIETTIGQRRYSLWQNDTRQTATILKAVKTQRSDSSWQSDAFQVIAIGEAPNAQRSDSSWQSDVRQVFATAEASLTQRSNPIRQSDARQATAIIEAPNAQRSDSSWQSDALQATAILETSIAQRSDSFWQSDACQTTATIEARIVQRNNSKPIIYKIYCLRDNNISRIITTGTNLCCFIFQIQAIFNPIFLIIRHVTTTCRRIDFKHIIIRRLCIRPTISSLTRSV